MISGQGARGPLRASALRPAASWPGWRVPAETLFELLIVVVPALDVFDDLNVSLSFSA